MSIFRDEFVFHGQLLADFAKQFSQVPAPLTPDSPPVSTDANTAPLSEGGESVLPFVNQQTGD